MMLTPETDRLHAGHLGQFLVFDRITADAQIDAQEAAAGTTRQPSDVLDQRSQRWKRHVLGDMSVDRAA
jgi:hypothetical protein